MALNLSKEERIAYENMLKTTEPYPDDDPVFNTLDGEYDFDRVGATLPVEGLEEERDNSTFFHSSLVF